MKHNHDAERRYGVGCSPSAKLHLVAHTGSRRAQKAYTLIELMITVVIVAILAAVAYPAYVKYTVKSNRAAAESHLMDIAQRQQQYLLDARSYASNLTALNLVTPSNVSRFYSISCCVTSSSPPFFTASAIPNPSTVQANDGTLSIDATGTKSPADKW